MALYRFLDKGPAYGLAYRAGELIELSDGQTLFAKPLVNELARDHKGVERPTGKMIHVEKKYTVDFLIESDVITPATKKEAELYKTNKHINAVADERTKLAIEQDLKQYRERQALVAVK